MMQLKIAHFAIDVVGLLILIGVVVYLTMKFGDLRKLLKMDRRQDDWTDRMDLAPRDGRAILVKIHAWNKPDGELLDRVAWWVDGTWREFPSRENTLWTPAQWKDLPQ